MATEHQISHGNYYYDTDYEDEYEDELQKEAEEEEEEEKHNPLHGMCGARGRWWWSAGRVLDPRASWVREWNRVFLLVCAASLFVDPLFFYTLSISEACLCLFVDGWLAVMVMVLRCMTDALHAWNIWLHLKINRRLHDTRARHVAMPVTYLKDKNGFFFDLFVILPLPQVKILHNCGKFTLTSRNLMLNNNYAAIINNKIYTQ